MLKAYRLAVASSLVALFLASSIFLPAPVASAVNGSAGTCTHSTDLGGGNFQLDCLSNTLPQNELSIAVDPSNPNHIVAGSMDFTLQSLNNTSFGTRTTAYYTSFDGGRTWLNGQIALPSGFVIESDPSVAFDAKFGTVDFGFVALGVNQSGTGYSESGIFVTTSTDGGSTFRNQAALEIGSGFSVDKPYITVDNNPNSSFYGRLYVTWSLLPYSTLAIGPVHFAYSSDGGKSFSTPTEISGSSATLCAHPLVSSNVGKCNEDFFSSLVVGPDGTLYVGFTNDEFQGAPNFRDQYLVVRSTDGGLTFQGPYQAVFPIYDGANDYPKDLLGFQSLSISQLRINLEGNLAADPTSGPSASSTRLYLVFSDNRDGGLTGNFSTVTTNTDVFVVRSDDGGLTWTQPNKVPGGAGSQNDQFFPWAAVSSNGVLKVMFMDRSYDPNNTQYGITLATSADHGVSFTSQRVDTGLSNPDDSRWFTDNGLTQGQAIIIGDYNGLAIGSDGVAHLAWTDMRGSTMFPNPPPGSGHNVEEAVTAAVPP